MSVIVRHIELADGVPDVDLPPGCSGLLAVVTFKGVPLGDITINTLRATLRSGFLTDTIAERFHRKLLQQWLRGRIERPESAHGSETLPAVEVVVCTSGRPADLERCAESISRCSYSPKSITIVDNGAYECERTREIAQRFGTRYLRERRRGLDFARNAGIRASDAEIIAFADDDVVVDRNWITSIVRAFLSDGAIACVTGLTMPLELETEAQELFEHYSDGGFRRGYERRVFHRFNLPPAAAGKCGAGANMAIRSSVLKQVGLFDEALDCGTPARAAGDTDMFYRLLRCGYKICYEPRAIAWHRHRSQIDELQKQLRGYSTAVYAFLTKCLVEYRDWNAITVSASWFKNHHVNNLRRCLLGRSPLPGRVVLAEIKGALCGPSAFAAAKLYVSKIKLEQQAERRGGLIRSGGSSFDLGNLRLIGPLLRRLRGPKGRKTGC